MTFQNETRLSYRVNQLLPRIAYRTAESPAERAEVYALRYRAYLREGAIRPNAAKTLSDQFDESPIGSTIGVFLDDKLCGSVRIHVASRDSETQSPATDAFPDILSDYIKRGDVIVDPNRLVIDKECSQSHPELAYIVLRVPFLAALHFGADLVTATVRPEHQAFYRRVLRFEVSAPVRSYQTLLTPLSLMTVHFPSEEAAVLRRYPFFAPRAEEAKELFDVASAAARVSPATHLPQQCDPATKITP
jgi:hypothetical protein